MKYGSWTSRVGSCRKSLMNFDTNLSSFPIVSFCSLSINVWKSCNDMIFSVVYIWKISVTTWACRSNFGVILEAETLQKFDSLLDHWTSVCSTKRQSHQNQAPVCLWCQLLERFPQVSCLIFCNWLWEENSSRLSLTLYAKFRALIFKLIQSFVYFSLVFSMM